MSKGLRTLLALIVVAAGAGCAVHQSDSAPPLTGPSGLARSVTISTSPDRLPWNGQSQSMVVVQVLDNGRPASAVEVQLDMLVGGTPRDDFGRLLQGKIVTGSEGKASTTYTAPMPDGNSESKTVTIRATPVGSNAQSALTFTADIVLVPAFILPPAGTPKAAFTTSPAKVAAGATVNFDASASESGSDASAIASYEWTFGDGTPTGSGQATTHVYAVPGTYSVKLTVTNNRGVAASTSQSVTVDALAPMVPKIEFSPSAPSSGQQVVFDGRGSTSAEGTSISSYSWSFLDGNPDQSGPVVSHAFPAPGTYVVRLTVVDNQNRTGTTTVNVTVK